MVRRSHTRQSHYTKTIVVKTESSEERDMFLSIGMPMLSDIDVALDTRLNRIELTLTGEYDAVDSLIGQLRKLESYIYNALYPGRDGYYLYHNLILTKTCTPPVNQDLFAIAIAVFGHKTETIDNEIKTEAPFEEIRRIHGEINRLRELIVDDLNRDIERFVIGLALTAQTDDVDFILDTSEDLELIKRTEYGYQFAVAPELARKKMIGKLKVKQSDATEVETEEYEDITLNDLLFEGGKVVFMKDGKEIDQSEFDT